MKKTRVASLLIVVALLLTMAIPSMAANAYTEVFDGGVIQDEFTTSRTTAFYKLTATETKYYKFSFENQSIEFRTGISIADHFLNMFLGKIDVQITDQYEKILSEFSVRCGYAGNVSLKLNEGETYYIKVSSVWDGFYKMKVNSYTDIGGDTWDTATESLSVGQMISSIDANGDKDWFCFETDSTDSFYTFRMENISGSSNMYMYVYEYVAGAGEIPLRDTFNMYASHGNTATKQLKLKSNAKYYVRISLNSGIGGYQLDITQTMDAVADTQDEAYPVDLDTKVTTALDGKGDVDWYTFTTKSYDAYYYFNVENLSLNDTYHLYVYDADGNELAYKWKYGSNDRLSVNVKLLTDTAYYFKVCSTSSGTGNYSFKITDEPDRFANTREDAGAIALNEEVYESVSGYGDRDFFKFTTESYEAYYYFKIQNLSLSDTYHLYVYDAEGNELAYKWTYGSNSSLSKNVKLSPKTTYYFMVCSTSEGTGNYKVTVTAKKDVYPNTQKEATQISLNKEISDSITGAGDRDFFKFTTTSFEAYYYFSMQNLSLNDTYHLYVYDADGNELAYKWTYGSNNSLSVNVKLSPKTTYYFMVCSTSEGTGNYKVTVSYVADAEGDTKEAAATSKMNTAYTKELSADSDVDWFKLTLTTDSNVRVVFTNESGGTKSVSLYSAINREMVYINCYGGNTNSKTVILDAGDYYIKVSGYSGFYTLAVGNCGSAHVEKYRYVQASRSADGIKTTYCGYCKLVLKKESISRISKISLSTTKYTYSGKARKPSVSVYDANGKEIPSSQYSLTYSSGRVKVGTYSVKVTFKGAYTGTKTLNYKIVAAPASTLKATLSTTKYTYNGKARKPSVTVKNASGDKLKSGTDYTVTYPSGRTKAGTYSVKITFKGNYTGAKTLKFTISAQSSSKLTAKLSTTKYTYNGKAKTPSVTVKNASGDKLKKGTDYTVTYPSGRKKVGAYKVKITFKGNYKGTEYLTFKINPEPTSVKKLTAKKKAIQVSIKKEDTQVTGYQVRYSTSKKFSTYTTKTVKSYKTTSYTITGLKSKKKYYVQVRTYKTVNGTKYYSGWSTYKYKTTK